MRQRDIRWSLAAPAYNDGCALGLEMRCACFRKVQRMSAAQSRKGGSRSTEEEEAASRKLEAEIKRLEEEKRAREKFVLMCKRQWAKGMKKRREDEVAAAEGIKIRKAKRERRRRESVRIMTEIRSNQEKSFKSPWEACRGGASVSRLKELIADEERRRRHQEGRAFTFDAVDHDIGENMLQIACWNNRPEIVGYLLNQGASMNRPSSIVTRTYPLHVAARKGAVSCSNTY